MSQVPTPKTGFWALQVPAAEAPAALPPCQPLTITIEAQVARCGATAYLTGWEVVNEGPGLIPHIDHPTQDGTAITLRPLFTLDMLAELLASGAHVTFTVREREVGALELACLPRLGSRQYDLDLAAWGIDGG